MGSLESSFPEADSNRLPELEERLKGAVLGAAVGDSLGLPAEGLTAKRIARLRWRPWRQRLFFGNGMVSDDTEHTFLVLKALARSGNDTLKFQHELARGLKGWFLSLPPGMGLATAKACLRLLVGISPERSGVRSAGNGPAMRCAAIGVFFREAPEQRDAFSSLVTRLTHTDPRALTGVKALVEVSALAAATPGGKRLDEGQVVSLLKTCANPEDDEWQIRVREIEDHLRRNDSVAAYFKRIALRESKGVSGYVYETVPMAIYAFLRHQDNFQEGIETVLSLGGDTDTVGAVTGALLGALRGEGEIPAEWISRIRDWPLSVSRLRRAVGSLAGRTDEGEPLVFPFFWFASLCRNLAFLMLVVGYVLLRYLPGGNLVLIDRQNAWRAKGEDC